MDKMVYLESLGVGGLLLITLITLTLLFVIGVLTGNIIVMRMLIRIGMQAFSGKPHKDYRLVKSFNKDTIGWIFIPDTTYSPILTSRGKEYEEHDYLKKPYKKGELHVNEETNAFHLTSIARPNTENLLLPDLTIIKGSSTVRKNHIRECRFTFLQKYLNTDLHKREPDITVIDNGKQRTFNLLFAVEIGIEEREKYAFKDRDSFINLLRGKAFVNTGLPHDNNIIILNGSTEFDTVLVFLIEKV